MGTSWCCGPLEREELQAVMLGEGVVMCGEPASSSTFTVDVE